MEKERAREGEGESLIEGRRTKPDGGSGCRRRRESGCGGGGGGRGRRKENSSGGELEEDLGVQRRWRSKEWKRKKKW